MSKFHRATIVVLSALVLISLGHVFVPATASESPLSPVSILVPSQDAGSLPAPELLPVSPSWSVTVAAARDDLSFVEVAPTAAAPVYQPFNSYVYIPTHAQERQPLQVVVALHGMGGEGKSFSATMIKDAERFGWLLVAPTIEYGDWHNPDVVASEEVAFTQRLIASIDALPARTSLALKPQVDIYGFSRGAQLAHRFAFFFPERVDRVVAFSAGTYTLPFVARNAPGSGGADAIPFPYGVSDLQLRLGHPMNQVRLREVRFLIGVGGADTVSSDVPRQWDEYLGKTRLERASEFVRALQRTGVPCSLKVYPSVGHEFTQPMLNSAVAFFSDPLSSSTPKLQ